MPLTITTTLTTTIIITNITTIIINITIIILFFIITTIIISISIIIIIIIIITSIISTTIITNFSSPPPSSFVFSSSLSLSSPASLLISPSSLLKSSLPLSPLLLFCTFLSIKLMLAIFNVDLTKCEFLFFNCKSLCSFSEYLLLYVNGFLKMLFSLIELSRFVFRGIFVTVCFSLILLLPKEIILKQKKSAKQRKYKNRQKAYPAFYILHYSLFIICLILLFNQIKQAKETRMSHNNVKNTIFFSINILEIQDSTRNSFLRCQLSYFALANIRLHRYHSFFTFTLLPSGDINVKRDRLP